MTSAKDLNINDLKGMPDVKFNFGVSASLKSAFRAAASLLDGQHGSRAQWRSHGAQDFAGYFSTVFTKNGTQQLSDLTQIATALRGVATKVEGVEQEAREENNRRKTARDWANRQAHRSWLHKMKDDVFGGEDPPDVQINDKGSSTTAPAVQPKTRELPKTGSGGGGGTSSARPSNLESFVTSSQGGDDAFSGTAGGLQQHCNSFATSCSWATLDASGPISALKDWLQLNSEDEKWASTVAKTFKAAGGDGNVSSLPNSAIAAALKKAHVSVYRSDILVAPAIAHGSPPTTGYSDDPINTATGNFIENESDLGFAGASSDLALTRTYNSLASVAGFRGAFGPGWASWSEAGLRFTDEAAQLRLSDGREIFFPRLADGWDRATGENLWLARREAGYRVIGATGLRWEFSEVGRLLSTSNGPGTAIHFGYDEGGRLTSMTHHFGRSVELSWDRELDRITSATTSDGRRADYGYDGQGRLTTVRTPAGTRSYRWNDAGLIAAVVDADGVVEAENSYDQTGRVLSQRSPYGRLTRYVYLPGGITSVSDEDGTRSNTWLCDSRGRLIGVIDADDQRQSTSYDRWGNPVMVTERNGAVTVNEYDDRGRPITQVTPSGARISWQYDDLGRPARVSVASTDDQGSAVDATTTYSYDGESRDPSRVIDPTGGVTLMDWVDGLLTKITDPVGVSVRFSHDDHGDLIATTDAEATSPGWSAMILVE